MNTCLVKPDAETKFLRVKVGLIIHYIIMYMREIHGCGMNIKAQFGFGYGQELQDRVKSKGLNAIKVDQQKDAK